MNETMRTGRISELAFVRRCLELRVAVLEPNGVERFDILVGLDGIYHRVQVKTGLLRRGAVSFNTCSNAEGVGRKAHYDGHADGIGVYCPTNNCCYWVPIGECPRGTGTLRIDPPRSGARRGIRWAQDFRFERWVEDWRRMGVLTRDRLRAPGAGPPTIHRTPS